MKRRFPTFLSGLLAGALLVGAAISALAISDHMTIDVYPINIQVNGETFVPRDVTGAEVPVFAYNGTTYAPLRALAEAYGLTVGYDAETNLATVTDPKAPPAPAPGAKQPSMGDRVDRSSNPYNSVYWDWDAQDEAAYQKFKGMWEVSFFDNEHNFEAICIDEAGLLSLISDMSQERVERLFGAHAADTIDAKYAGEDFFAYGFYDLQDGSSLGQVEYYGAYGLTGGVMVPATVVAFKDTIMNKLSQ